MRNKGDHNPPPPVPDESLSLGNGRLRYGESSRFETMPSRPNQHSSLAWRLRAADEGGHRNIKAQQPIIRSGGPLGCPMMKYRGIEYAVVQGIGRQVWKWSASVTEVVIRGQAATKFEAVAEAERAIDRALAPKKLRLVPPGDRD